jgi:hypothetical protein
VSLVAPWLFNGYWELHTLLFGGLIGVLVMLATRPSSWLNRRSRWITVPLIVVVWLGIELALVFHVYRFVSGSNYLSRNFYGVTRVINQGLRNPNKIPKRIIKHGDTRHGSQFLTRQHRLEPTGYYVRSSGVGRAIRSLKNHQPSVNIGVVGLGAGVLASYGDTGDVVQFYEINPDIIKLSTGKKPMFTFLNQCPCETRIIKGDARLSMEDELRKEGSKDYDVLAIDVFQNDSPPAHLLTIEAFRLYLKHLDRNGIMAFHVSNRYLNLEKLIHQYVRMEGLHDRQVISMEQNTASRWIVVSRSEEALKGPAFDGALTVPIGDADVPIWTDQYSNLFTLIDWEIPGWSE